MSAREIVGSGIIGVALIAISILGLIIHVWTIVIAFVASGLLAAVLTLIFPVLSEVYWFFKVGSNISFKTIYCISIMVYIALLGVALLGAMIASPSD